MFEGINSNWSIIHSTLSSRRAQSDEISEELHERVLGALMCRLQCQLI